jgi:hypothetical protein
MKILAFTILLSGAFLTATWPVQAQEVTSTPSPSKTCVKAPQFITRGNPLTGQEVAMLNQRSPSAYRISREAGGKADGDKTAVAVILGVIVGTAIVVIAVASAKDSVKL